MKTPPFIHREQELSDLDYLTRHTAEPALILVYGRRRVGKSTLLRRWAKRSALPTFYWESPYGNANFVLTQFMSELYRWAGEPVVEARPPAHDWLNAFRALRRIIGDRRVVVILDEFPWAVESNDALPSLLKNAWDNVFADSKVILFILGSHISAMERLLLSDAPLFGRMTGKLYVRPFSFDEIGDFVPRYSLEKRLAAYSIVGGIPDYLQRWDDSADLMTNINDIFLSDLSPYRNEQLVLISDVLRRDSPDYVTVLNVIGSGKHDPAEISASSAIPTSRTANVLKTLVEVRLVERRIRASVPVDKHEDARHARYFLADPFLQFYYRFVASNRSRIALGRDEELRRIFAEQLRGYVGLAFEQLCRAWTLAQAQAGTLPVSPDYIGSDWVGQRYQADVVAVNWQDRAVLVGEAKWTERAVDKAVLTELEVVAAQVVERLQAALPSKDRERPWQTHLVIFARRGATPPLRAALAEGGRSRGQHNAQLVTFATLVRDLAEHSAHRTAERIAQRKPARGRTATR